MFILPALDKIMIYASVLLCVSPRCLSERVLEVCIWPSGVNSGQFCPKWHECWPGHCIMDELQPLISLSPSSLSSGVAKCIIQLPRVREQREDGSVTVRERERLWHPLWWVHTQTLLERTLAQCEPKPLPNKSGLWICQAPQKVNESQY